MWVQNNLCKFLTEIQREQDVKAVFWRKFFVETSLPLIGAYILIRHQSQGFDLGPIRYSCLLQQLGRTFQKHFCTHEILTNEFWSFLELISELMTSAAWSCCKTWFSNSKIDSPNHVFLMSTIWDSKYQNSLQSYMRKTRYLGIFYPPLFWM